MINATFDHVDVTFNEADRPDDLHDRRREPDRPSGRRSRRGHGVTQLDATDYRVSFAALTERGTYQVAIGPNIADPQGNLMDQNQNGTNGEPADDSSYRSLNYVVARHGLHARTRSSARRTRPTTARTSRSRERPSRSTARTPSIRSN